LAKCPMFLWALFISHRLHCLTGLDICFQGCSIVHGQAFVTQYLLRESYFWLQYLLVGNTAKTMLC
jgi:hypothetical protein